MKAAPEQMFSEYEISISPIRQTVFDCSLYTGNFDWNSQRIVLLAQMDEDDNLHKLFYAMTKRSELVVLLVAKI